MRYSMTSLSITEFQQKARLWTTQYPPIFPATPPIEILTVFNQDPSGGVVQVIYENLARQFKKNGTAVLSFWDRQCLNYGQDWEEGFLEALQSSNVIILLISLKVLSINMHG